jgi:hypothetical protein
MAITPPTNDDLAEIAGRYRLGLDAGDVDAFRQIITGAMASYDAVERMYQAHAGAGLRERRRRFLRTARVLTGQRCRPAQPAGWVSARPPA